MPENVIACVDVGKDRCGLSLFVGGQLGHAELVGGKGGQIHPLLEVGDLVEQRLAAFRESLGLADLLILECPKIYDQQHQKGDQRDLVRLAVVLGTILRGARPHVRSAIDVEPWEWKGQVKKDVMCRRVESKLTPAELARVELPSADGLKHNVWDAVGIGLWRLGRIGK